MSFSAALLASFSSKTFSACSMSVIMSPMSRMRPAMRSGWNDVEVGELLARRREHDRPAGDRAYGQRRTAAGVAVELGEHDAGEVDALEERLGRDDGVLADHRVDDEQHLVGIDRGADVGGLLHQLFVDAEATGGVDDHDVVQRAPRLGEAVAWRP